MILKINNDYFQVYGFIKNFYNMVGWKKDDDAGSFDELFYLKKIQERDGLF